MGLRCLNSPKAVPPNPTPDPTPVAFRRWWPPAVIACAVLATYAGSLTGQFVYNDQVSIAENPTIRHLWPLWDALSPPRGGLTVSGRPVLNLSFAFNYAISGTAVWSYHGVNVAIHLLAGLTLFGVMRRALALRRIQQASMFAFGTALLWSVHPLATEAVTYLSQRAESQMGLFFLFCFYAFIRSTESGRPLFWQGLCVASFYLGIGTKENMVAALPLLVLFDAAFVSGSLRAAWLARSGLWVALASGILLLAMLLASNGGNRGGSIGLGVGVSPVAYAMTQPQAILTYLKLSVVPTPLIFDYGFHWARPSLTLCIEVAAVGVLLGASILAWFRSPAWGFLGAWFFVILAPTSLAPGTTQMIVEHRMYLPLIAVLAPIVVGLGSILRRLALPALLALALALGCFASLRNEVYRNEETLWSDTVAKRPDNDLAHNNLGNAIRQTPGRLNDAINQFQAAIRLRPDVASTHNNLAVALAEVPDRRDEAIVEYEEALRLNPGYAAAHDNLGALLETMPGRAAEAVAHIQEALRLRPDFAEAHVNLGDAWSEQPGRLADAVVEYQTALRLQPDLTAAHYNLGNALRRTPGRLNEAIAELAEAVRLKPDYLAARNNLGNALRAAGRKQEAIDQFEAVLHVNPNSVAAHINLAIVLSDIPGRADEAVAHLEEALRLQPGNESARAILARLR